MREMLKKSNYIRSRRLNTIIEMAETQDENENSLVDSIPAKEQISSCTCTAARTPNKIPSGKRSVTRSPHVEQVVSSHATPQTPRLSTTSHWREKPSVSTKPAGIDKISNTDALTLTSPVFRQDISEVELFFPEFFTNSEAQRVPIKTDNAHKETNKYTKNQSEDPLVQSWMDLFGPQVYG